MGAKVRIPVAFRKYVKNQTEIDVEGDTLGKVMAGLIETIPEIKGKLYDDDGQIRKYLNIYINQKDVRYLNGVNSSVKDGDEIALIPTVVGG